VVSGSSGRVETERAEALAEYGVATLAVPWFGVPGLPASPRRVPLETFLPHLDRLAEVAPQVGMLGTSFGAEAALLLAAREPRLTLVAALAPTSVVWETSDQDAGGHPVRDAKWTWGGEPIPGVPCVDQHVAGPFADARSWHEASLAGCPDPAAYAIPVERFAGQLLVSAGGDDRVWPSARFCEEIVSRRRTAGLETTYVFHAEAGHRVVLPGEAAAPDRPGFPRGGTPEADAEHGAAVLRALLSLV
jgi:pimeloyl-ACP methyl ester carboxylesterase